MNNQESFNVCARSYEKGVYFYRLKFRAIYPSRGSRW